MRRDLMQLLILLSLTVSPSLAQTPPPAAATAPGCALIQHALADIGGVKVGMRRGDLEKRFKITHKDAFRNQAVYAYKTCPLIKVRVTFSTDPNKDSSATSTDFITTMSQLFLSQDPGD